MCGGMLGEAVEGIDKAANSINPMKDPMQWLTDNTVSKVYKPAGQLYDFSNSHPLESLGAMAAAYGGAAALGGDAAAGGGAGALGDAGTGSLDVGMGGAGSYDAELGGQSVLGGAGGDASTAGIGGVGAGVDPASGMSTAGIGNAGNSGTSFLSNLFGGGSGGGGSGIGLNMSTAKNGLGLAQIISSLYGMDQSRKLSKAATSQAYSAAGAQAVTRSMAAQGYQGSGNMMTALSNYGASAYGNNLQQQQTSLSNTMSGLGLLTAGVGNLAGWGSATPTKPGG